MDLTICTGGACTERGADLLYEATCVLSSADEKLWKARGGGVKTAFCSGECPPDGAMMCPKRAMVPSYVAPCQTVEEAIASAEDALEAAGAVYDASLKEAYLAKLKGDAASLEADHAGALEAYAAAVAATPAALLEQPSQPELPDESLEWDSSKWSESLFGTSLTCGETITAFEYASCGKGGCVQLVDCTSDEETRTLSGMWEHTEDGSGGSFAITMSENGRKFAGTLTEDADGEAKEWTGMRKSSGRGAGRMRGEKPSKRFEWLHELLLAKSTAALSSGDAAGAVEDATLATALCCQTASGWEALAAAKEAAGDDEGAQAAREEADWLKSYA